VLSFIVKENEIREPIYKNDSLLFVSYLNYIDNKHDKLQISYISLKSFGTIDC
jgi:hypothetical protein